MRLVIREEIEHQGILDFASQKRYFAIARARGFISQKGEFLLVRDGIVQNPGPMIGTFYFTSEDAALNFYQLFLKELSKELSYRVFLCRRVKDL